MYKNQEVNMKYKYKLENVAEWVLRKNIRPNQMASIIMESNRELLVIKRTEKALHLVCLTDSGPVKFWCPISAITE